MVRDTVSSFATFGNNCQTVQSEIGIMRLGPVRNHDLAVKLTRVGRLAKSNMFPLFEIGIKVQQVEVFI